MKELTSELLSLLSELRSGRLDKIGELELYGRALMIAQAISQRGRKGRQGEQQLVHAIMKHTTKDLAERDVIQPNIARFLNIFYSSR